MAPLLLRLCAALAVMLLVVADDKISDEIWRREVRTAGKDVTDESVIKKEVAGPSRSTISARERAFPWFQYCHSHTYHRFVNRRLGRLTCTGYVIVSSCHGYCWSSAYTYPNNNGYMYTYTNCQCCQPTGRRLFYFPFICRPRLGGWPITRHFGYYVFNECACSRCNGYILPRKGDDVRRFVKPSEPISKGPDDFYTRVPSNLTDGFARAV